MILTLIQLSCAVVLAAIPVIVCIGANSLYEALADKWWRSVGA